MNEQLHTQSIPEPSYHERLLEQSGRPHIIDCPQLYEPDQQLIDALNHGEFVSETHALSSYFVKQRAWDPQYMKQVDRIISKRAEQFPDAGKSMADRRLQFIIPAYREGGNITPLLQNLKNQFDQTGLGQWGVTFVFDYAIPYKNPSEDSAVKAMETEIEAFLAENPTLRPYIDTIFYTRRAGTTTPVLPVGLARKVGEDVIMSERLRAQNINGQPLYLGLMDCDLNTISDGTVTEILSSLPQNEGDPAKIIRVKGSFDRTALAQNPELHPLEMMWEGMTSEVGKNSKHNPFTVGRMSVVPARELAMTGGAFAKKLQFPDEDIRHGIQIAWQINDIATVEVTGKYATSPRREIDTVRSLLAMLRENGGKFTMETLEYASLIRMYGGWAQNTFRDEFGNIHLETDRSWNPLEDPEQFRQIIPSELLEVSANARYRFGLFSKFAIDELANHPDAPEIQALKNGFLRGDIPSFMVEFHAVDLIRMISQQDPARFERLKPALARADAKARQSIGNILSDNRIEYEIENPDTPIYILEANMLAPQSPERDNTPLRAPIHISPDMSGYMTTIRSELVTDDRRRSSRIAS